MVGSILSLFRRLLHVPSQLRNALAVFLASVLLGGGLAAIVVQGERGRLLADHGQRMESAAAAMAGRLDAGLQEWGRDVALLTRFAAFHAEPPEPAAARRLLDDLKTRSPDFSWIGFTGPDGRVIAATGGLLEGMNVAARPWFAGGLEGLYLGDVHPAVLLARLLPASEGGEAAYFVDAAAPVVSADGRILGVIAGHMNWLWAERVREEMARLSPDRPAPEFLVLGADDGVLLGPEEMRGRPLVDAALAAGRGQRSGWVDSGDGRITGFARTQGSSDHPGLGWVVLARRDAAGVLAPLWSQAAWMTLGVLALAAMAGLATWAVAAGFGRALRKLGGEGITGADFNADLERMAATLRRLRDTAWRDPLTGLLNRAGFAEWRAAHPDAERDCALLMLDLDGFKPINDRLGHAAGDAVLAAIGRWLEVNLRLGDCAVRMGGDEFLLCLCGPTTMSEIAADEVSARLQAALAEGLETPMGRLSLGCSIGVAILPRDAQTIDAGIEHADRALYEVKRRRQAARGAAAQAR
ncbi:MULTISPECIES: GGDEF domain-containing protein [Roseomonadaceae]|uniref:GGDEF domain-containing protein n=1 Tax=Falsiroseomonas oleicola TaxID=2801474 RepID=A0ABS6H9Z7_9PROT|nr:diguanylate cyclase [Roseomonas oleicola]MBU8545509.1 GGDEF domain-containing protein [Roseomonas oleicola]